jgi:RNA polymerase-interacting CarD/CdnL/TRCF family regulator
MITTITKKQETIVITGDMTVAQVASALKTLIKEKTSQKNVATEGQERMMLQAEINQLESELKAVEAVPNKTETFVHSMIS